MRDEQLRSEITRVWKENYEVYGADKVWLELNLQGSPLARCTTEGLIRGLGVQGVRRGRKVCTTVSDERHERAGDLLGRDFTAPVPNRRRVADFTHVAGALGVLRGADAVMDVTRALADYKQVDTHRWIRNFTGWRTHARLP